MARSYIKVDYEWAFNKVVGTHDLSCKSPSWIKTFVEGWCDGFLEGYMIGNVESNIKIMCALKKYGMSSEQIKNITGVSSDIIDMMNMVHDEAE